MSSWIMSLTGKGRELKWKADQQAAATRRVAVKHMGSGSQLKRAARQRPQKPRTRSAGTTAKASVQELSALRVSLTSVGYAVASTQRAPGQGVIRGGRALAGARAQPPHQLRAAAGEGSTRKNKGLASGPLSNPKHHIGWALAREWADDRYDDVHGMFKVAVDHRHQWGIDTNATRAKRLRWIVFQVEQTTEQQKDWVAELEPEIRDIGL